MITEDEMCLKILRELVRQRRTVTRKLNSDWPLYHCYHVGNGSELESLFIISIEGYLDVRSLASAVIKKDNPE